MATEQLFQKQIQNPYLGREITLYTDLIAASVFHNGMLLPVLDTVRLGNQEQISNEDNEIEMYLRMAGPNAFRLTYRFSHDEPIKAITIMVDEHSNLMFFNDPLMVKPGEETPE